MRFDFDLSKSVRLRRNSKRGIGFEDAREIFDHPYGQSSSDISGQYRAVGWVGQKLYTVVFEVREDEKGEFYHFVTLWKATREERKLYEEHT